MNILSIRHLYWVLWIWLLLTEANGEEGVGKSKKRLVIKQESGPRGDSLVTSFVQTRTRVSRAFSSTTTFRDEGGEDDDNNKPPDDRQSTIRIRNETADPSKNTVPVLRYPGPTEPSLKDKYRRTTPPAETGPAKKNFKLKRNMTRPRPADLTTLLAFNALSPSPQQGQSGRPKPAGYPSTTQVAESMPPTAWALAGLRAPSGSTRKPGSPYVKPFVSWSTRLSKPTTTLSPTTELLESVTTTGETSTFIDTTATDITAEGIDKTETAAHHTADAGSIAPVTSPDNDSNLFNKEPSSSLTESSTPSMDIKAQTTIISSNNSSDSTEKPQDITSHKPEENTISVPPLSSLKNLTNDEIIEKRDSSPDTLIQGETELRESTNLEVNSNPSKMSDSQTETSVNDFSNSSSTTSQEKLQPTQVNTDSPAINISSLISESNSDGTELSRTSISPEPMNSEQSSEPTAKKTVDSFLAPESQGLDQTILNATEGGSTKNNSILIDEEVKKDTKTKDDKEMYLHLTSEKPILEDTRPNDRIITESPLYTEHEKVTNVTHENVLNETVQELDPSINSINEKKGKEQLSANTVVSTVNSSFSIQMSPTVSTPGTVNLTNLIEEEVNKSVSEYDMGKNLPLTAETTVSTSTHSVSSPPAVLGRDHSLLQPEQDHDIINQTSNYIKQVNDIKYPPIPLESNTETTSITRSNEIKPEIPKSDSQVNMTNNGTEITHKLKQDLPETTQSNYIQVHENIKPQNKTLAPHFEVHGDLEKQNDFKTPPPLTTIIPMALPSTDIPSESVNLPNNSTDAGAEAVTTSSPTTLETEPPITTTPPPTTTVIPVSSVTTPSSTTNSTPSIASPSSTEPPHPTTIKSNDIKDQESLSDINLPLSEKNMTHFQYESPNIPKNESTPFIIQEPDDIDDDDVAYNHTDFSDKKNPSDPINTGDSEDDNDENFHDVIGNSSIPVNNPNITNNNVIPILTSTLSTAPSTKPTSTTPSIFDVIATQTDEEPPSIDEDTIYDTGVIMPVYTRLIFDANYGQLCRDKELLRDAIVRIFKKYTERCVDKKHVVLINLGLRECSSLRGEMNERHTPVHLILTDSQGQYDKTLNDQFVSLVRERHLEFKYPITQVDKIIEHEELNMDADTQPSGTVVAAIIISSIAAVCLFALTILLVIMRKRQTGFNYGQRCTPVSLDDYSLDNISVYNSVRRKAMRASKRSYGNPAFDDPDTVSNPVNFAGLANMASDKSKTDEEFASLPQVVVKPDELPPGADSKNRYANIIPLPETRVQLKGGNSPEEQFINANYVKGAKGCEKFYIACQAPLQNTIEDFWQMIWDEQCRLVIMLTALSENGVEKCADYLPPSEVLDCHRIFGNLQVTLKKREAREKYVIASLQLKNLETNLWREVTHMWYAGWPATGVPSEPSSIIAFLIEARSYTKGAPVVVHCSPGTGRTGTVIAIDIAIRDFEAGRSVDIPKTVLQVRRGRAGAIQTKDQYHFIYKVLHFYATKLTGGGLDSI